MSVVLRILGASASRCRPWGLATLLAGGLLLAGCGQKGPLFLPAPDSKAPATSTNPAPR